jgi:hypothetical protein
MTYSNPNQPENDSTAQQITPVGIQALISALSHAATNNEVAHLPTVRALKALSTEVNALQKQTIDQNKAIDQLRLELKQLKQRDSERSARLEKYMNRPTIIGCAALLGLIILVPLVLLHTFVPSKADRDINDIKEKSEFLYYQELERFSKKKKG